MVVTTLSRKGSRAYSSAVPRVISAIPARRIDTRQARARQPCTYPITPAMSTELTSAKRALRAELRATRDALPLKERQDRVRRAHSHLAHCKPWTDARAIAGYLPHQSEFDPLLMMRDALEHGVRVVCPRVVGKTLQFHEWQTGDPTETAIGGVLQPTDSGAVTPAEDIDLFLTPLLGVGEHGIRLGYGGGFYDRLFAEVEGFKLGVGFAIQQVDRWEIEAHDQKLDAFLSEEGLTVFT